MLNSFFKTLDKTESFSQAKYLWFFFLILFAAVYKKIPNLYFQGDEWVFFRQYIEAVRSPFWPVTGLVRVFTETQQLGFHLSPLLETIYVWTFRLFGLNQMPYLIIYSLVHVLNSVLVFLFARVVSKNSLISFASSIFFLISVSHHQAFTWISAAPGTTLATTFMLLTFIFFFRYLESGSRKDLRLSFLTLFLGLMTKETAITAVPALIIFYLVFKRDFSPVRLVKNLWGVWASLSIFILIRVIFSNLTPSQETATSLTLFRYFSFSLKSFSQTFIPSHLGISASAWITDMQFPFFNAEKEVRGTTYLSFIQGPGAEFWSYIFTLFILLVLVLVKLPRKTFLVSAVIFLSGIIPIVAITYMFPWWGYSSIVDSRHLYHLSIVSSLLFGTVVWKLSQRAGGLRAKKEVYFWLLGLWLFWQWGYIQSDLRNLETDAVQRKHIVSTMQEQIGTPPKKMIIYTQSNKSYYGFAFWMLPFQTAFSHMLPVMFGQPYYARGHNYPLSFYGKEYLPKGGLVTQGYFEDGEYGIGYFLEDVPVIKILEENGYSPDIVYAFNYDGDSYELKNETEEFRKKLSELLDSRSAFRSWKRYGSQEHMFSFQADPTWKVSIKNNVYQISDQDGEPILGIEVLENKNQEQFSVFSGRQLIDATPVGTDYILRQLKLDLDIHRNIIVPNANENIFFTVAGNNLMFYRFEISNKEKARLILRTLEFVDQEGEEITLN